MSQDCIAKRKETVQVIGDLITAWILPFEISEVVVDSPGVFILSVPKTYYLQKGKRRKIIIDAIEYEITEVVNNESVTVTGISEPPIGTINLPVPFYFNGTIVQTNTELKKEADIWKKTPMIFLRRPFTEKLDARDLIDTDIANKGDYVFYFLTEANFNEWLTEDHDTEAIVPMRNMIYEFIELLKSNVKYIERLTDFDVTDLIKFGIVSQNGVTKGLFSDNYSGAQLDISLGLKYQCVCPD